MRYLYFVSFFLFFIASACNDTSQNNVSSISFKEISSSHSGIDFINKLKEDVSTNANLFDFDYFYNGAGVAVVDINNDDLLDLIFTANQVGNKIYLNKGDLTFEDITEGSGINTNKYWSNGITSVDINNDGWQDLYISQGGPHSTNNRANLLLINNKDLTFTESAALYGLDDKGISTQSAFFDYDKDGDLDCFVMNESLLFGYDPITFQRTLLEQSAKNYVSFSHLYRNNDNVFTDVSEDAGITKPTYGLGLSIADINEDGYPDIYVANDYYLPDNVYINRKNGTFRDRGKTHLTQTSFFGMGVDIADINNDGHQDIYVLDMASQDHIRSKTLMASMDVESFDLLTEKFGFLHQYMFNSLQLNNGEGRFKNIAHSAGVAKTDWSWAALIEDVDLDGDKDIFVSNGYRKYALDNDFKIKVSQAKNKFDGAVPINIKQKLYDEMPTEALPNLMYINDGNLKFKDRSAKMGLEASTYSNGAALADLDNDGDLDLVINNIDQTALLYENNASDYSNYLSVQLPEGSSGVVTLETTKGLQVVETRRVRGYRSSVHDKVHFGLGAEIIVEKLTVDWKDGTISVLNNVKANQSISVDKKNVLKKSTNKKAKLIMPFAPIALGLDYRHEENDYNDFQTEILLPQKQSTMGPCIAQADVNGDGLEDLYFGGASNQAGILYISKGSSYIKTEIVQFNNDKIHEDVDAIFFDIDKDGDQDLFVVSGGNEWPEGDPNYYDRLYINDGSGNFSKQSLATEYPFSGGVVKKLDFDQDGDDDILVGNRIKPQSYPIAAPSLLLENQEGQLINVTSEYFPDLLQEDIINDIEIIDLNGDDYPDVVATGEWSGIRFFVNDRGSFKVDDLNSGFIDSTGWWYSITKTDVDNDGLTDLLIGNVGTNIKHKASAETPFKIYANDFDESGTLDVVLSNRYKDQEVPVRGKECSSQQMPFIAEKFPRYSDFATSSLGDIYGEDNIANSYSKNVRGFESILLKQYERGRYKWTSLPQEANHFPLLDAISADLNGDGYEDLLAVGAMNNTEVETPRLDAGTGQVLLSTGNGQFSIGECPEHCFYVSGNVKKMHRVEIENKDFIIVLKNDGALALFELKTK